MKGGGIASLIAKGGKATDDQINAAEQSLSQGGYLNAESMTRGEALGNVATMLGASPESAVKGIGVAGKTVGKIPVIGEYLGGKIGKVADNLYGKTTAGKLDAAVKQGLDNVADTLASKTAKITSDFYENELPAFGIKRAGADFVDAETGGPLEDSQKLNLDRAMARAQKAQAEAQAEATEANKNLLVGRSVLKTRLGQIGAAGIAGTAGLAGYQGTKNDPGVAAAGQESHLLMPVNQQLSIASGDQARIKIGGMFGAGEHRLIQMTKQMVDLLGQIAVNTKSFTGNPTQSGPFGGHSAPPHRVGHAQGQ
jgi:hypothetical protein